MNKLVTNYQDRIKHFLIDVIYFIKYNKNIFRWQKKIQK